MKKILIPFMAFLVMLTSCEMVNKAVPDVDTDVVKTFNVVIDTNLTSGESDTTFVDITEYQEYEDYSDFITGYAIDRISFEITDYNAPEDLYFDGSIMLYDADGNIRYSLAELEAVDLSSLAADGTESDLTLNQEVIDQLLLWLDDPGAFGVNFLYGFKNSDGTDYNFSDEDAGSTFKVKVHFHLVLLTGFNKQ